ncbi:MAG: hypothetical protein ACR2KK_18460 [Acidimicrobiales bacterium]
MRLPRLFTTALWLAVTAVSTAMVWTATSIVANDVTDRAASVLARQEVVSELESSAQAANTTTSSTIPKATSPTSTVLSRGRGPAPASPNAPVPTTPQSPASPPAVTIAPASPSTTAPAASPTSPTTRPASPPTTQTSPVPTATYSTSGGAVRVACDGFFIKLISAIPSNGYAVNVVAAGPVNVEVHFVRSDRDVSVKAVCFGQPIRYYDQNPPRQASG